MEVKAKVKFVRMSPRKVRLVVDVVRGMGVDKALDQLKFTNKLATKPVIKLINSAIANAENNYELERNNLFVKEIKVDDGPTAYRWMPRAHGRATPLRKRTSHINLVLAEIKDSGKKEAKKQKIESPVKLDTKPEEEKKEAQKKKNESKESKGSTSEEGKNIVDPRQEGRGGHTKIEGKSHKGFTDKIFRRKSG